MPYLAMTEMRKVCDRASGSGGEGKQPILTAVYSFYLILLLRLEC